MTGACALLALAVALPALAVGPGPSVVQRTTSVQEVQLPRGSESVTVEVRTLQLKERRPGSEPAEVGILTLYEPGTGLFWWRRWNADLDRYPDTVDEFFSHHHLVLGRNKISALLLTSAPPTLSLRESRERFVNSEEAHRNLRDRLEEILRDRHYDPNRGYRTVRLDQIFDRDFFADPASAAPGIWASIVEAENTGPRWTVVLEGWNGSRATLTLNGSFELLNQVVTPLETEPP